MHIRAIEQVDKETLALIHMRCWQDTYRGIVSDVYLDGMSLEKNLVRWDRVMASPNPKAVLEENGEPIGFITWGPVRGTGYGYQQEIYSFYLLQQHRGKGYGKQALDYIHQQVPEPMMVWVLSNNPYIGFYEKYGRRLPHTMDIVIGGDPFTEVLFEV